MLSAGRKDLIGVRCGPLLEIVERPHQIVTNSGQLILNPRRDLRVLGPGEQAIELRLRRVLVSIFMEMPSTRWALGGCPLRFIRLQLQSRYSTAPD